MRQKKLFDGRSVPAIWQGGSVTNANMNHQSVIWAHGVKYGCNAIDTAENYGDGWSEQIVGNMLKSVPRENVFVASKVAPEHMKEADVIYACEQSLKRMGTDYIDLYQIHWYNPKVSLFETISAMVQLRKQGKIRYVGVSNFTLPQIEEAMWELEEELASVQAEYSLTNRVCERDIIPYCDAADVLFLAYTPLNKLDYKNPVLRTIAKRYGRTVPQVALNWITAKHNVCALPKTSLYSHLIENAQSTEFELSEEDYNTIAREFNKQVELILPSEISCVGARSGIGGDAGNGVPAYVSIEEAEENRHGLTPSPLELSKELEQTMTLSKPIIVRRKKDGGYQLVNGGGGIRYWAWVIAFGMDVPVECIVEGH